MNGDICWGSKSSWDSTFEPLSAGEIIKALCINVCMFKTHKNFQNPDRTVSITPAFFRACVIGSSYADAMPAWRNNWMYTQLCWMANNIIASLRKIISSVYIYIYLAIWIFIHTHLFSQGHCFPGLFSFSEQSRPFCSIVMTRTDDWEESVYPVP